MIVLTVVCWGNKS